MIYQFEHEEVKSEDIREAMAVLQSIRYSREEIARKVLPAWAQPYRAIDKAVILSLESLERDLVAIAKTETTSCKWCDNADEMEVAVKTVFNSGKSVGIKRFSSSKSTFCPNCGRKLD